MCSPTPRVDARGRGRRVVEDAEQDRSDRRCTRRRSSPCPGRGSAPPRSAPPGRPSSVRPGRSSTSGRSRGTCAGNRFRPCSGQPAQHPRVVRGRARRRSTGPPSGPAAPTSARHRPGSTRARPGRRGPWRSPACPAPAARRTRRSRRPAPRSGRRHAVPGQVEEAVAAAGGLDLPGDDRDRCPADGGPPGSSGPTSTIGSAASSARPMTLILSRPPGTWPPAALSGPRARTPAASSPCSRRRARPTARTRRCPRTRRSSC